MTDQLTTQRDTEQNDVDEEAQPPEDPETGITYITRQEGELLLDRQARKYLDMSGAEFKRRYREGTIEDPDRPAVIRLSLLIYLAEK